MSVYAKNTSVMKAECPCKNDSHCQNVWEDGYNAGKAEVSIPKIDDSGFRAMIEIVEKMKDYTIRFKRAGEKLRIIVVGKI